MKGLYWTINLANFCNLEELSHVATPKFFLLLTNFLYVQDFKNLQGIHNVFCLTGFVLKALSHLTLTIFLHPGLFSDYKKADLFLFSSSGKEFFHNIAQAKLESVTLSWWHIWEWRVKQFCFCAPCSWLKTPVHWWLARWCKVRLIWCKSTRKTWTNYLLNQCARGSTLNLWLFCIPSDLSMYVVSASFSIFYMHTPAKKQV